MRRLSILAVALIALAISACSQDDEPFGLTQRDAPSVPTATLASVMNFNPTEPVPFYATELDIIADGGGGGGFVVGTAFVWNDGTDLKFNVVIDEPWMLCEVHIHAIDETGSFPTAGPGNPKVGKFMVNEVFDPCASTPRQFSIPLDEIDDPLPDDELAVALHVKVRQEICCVDSVEPPCYEYESGWAEGDDFGGRTWAMKFDYTVLPEITKPFYVVNSGNLGTPFSSAYLQCDEDDIPVHGAAHLRSHWWLFKSAYRNGTGSPPAGIRADEPFWWFQAGRNPGYETGFSQYRLTCYDVDWWPGVSSASDVYMVEEPGVYPGGANIDGNPDPICDPGDQRVGAGWFLRTNFFVNKIRPYEPSGEGYDFQARLQEDGNPGDGYARFQAMCYEGPGDLYENATNNVAGNFAGLNLSATVSCDMYDIATSGVWHLRSDVYANKSRRTPADEAMWEFQVRVQDDWTTADAKSYAKFWVTCFDWAN